MDGGIETPLHLAHAVSPASAVGWWLLVASLATATTVFIAGAARLRGRTTWNRHTIAFVMALVTLALVLSPWVEDLAAQSFAAHMSQHVTLMVLVAPLTILARPSLPLWRGSPRVLRRAGTRLSRWRVVTNVVEILRKPSVAWTIAVVTLWLWHLPALFEAALASALVHVLEHAFLVTASLLFWDVALSPRRNFGDLQAALYVFTAGLAGAMLGALITFSGSLWYGPYAPGDLLSASTDQVLAGLVMWIPTGIVYVAVALILVYRWLRDLEQRAPGEAAAESL